MYRYINILIIIIFYLKKVGSRCFDPQFQKWVAMWAGVINIPVHRQLKRKTQSPCLIKDYRNAELTSSPCVYVDGPRNNVDMTDRTRCLHELYAISEKNVIKWSIAQIIFNVHIKITKHCDDKIKE
jgi:hypothetical protein